MSNVNTPDVLAHSMAESLMRENKALRAEVADLKEHNEHLLRETVKMAADVAAIQREHDVQKTRLYAEKRTLTQQLAAANGRVEMLSDAIQQTLDENRHLADGDTCTLILLKRAISNR